MPWSPPWTFKPDRPQRPNQSDAGMCKSCWPPITAPGGGFILPAPCDTVCMTELSSPLPPPPLLCLPSPLSLSSPLSPSPASNFPRHTLYTTRVDFPSQRGLVNPCCLLQGLRDQQKADTEEDAVGVAAGTYEEVVLTGLPQGVAATVQRIAGSLHVCLSSLGNVTRLPKTMAVLC